METETRWYALPLGNGHLNDYEFMEAAENAGTVLSNTGLANWLNGNTENPADMVKYEFRFFEV